MREELERLVDNVLSDDPRAALAAYHDLSERQLPWLEQRAVALARREGMSWAVIGRLLGRSRQAVRERFASMIPRPAPGRFETGFERALRQQNEKFERLLHARPTADDDPIAW